MGKNIMAEDSIRSVGPFSMLKRKSRKRSEKRRSRKLRDILGEKNSFDDDYSESDDSKYSSGLSSSQASNDVVGYVNTESDANQSVSAGRMRNNAGNDKSLTNINKSDEYSVENVGDIELRQNYEQGIVGKECSGMNELTKRIESMNDTMKQNKNTTDLHCQEDIGLDSAGKTEEGDAHSLATDSPSSRGSRPSPPNARSKDGRESDARLVKRKHNMFYHEVEEGGNDSGLGERGTPRNENSFDSRTDMNNDHNDNTPSNKSDGLLTKFGERQSSGIARKRHIASNASDFEKKMSSPVSSRSSSVRSYTSSVPASIDSGLRMGFQEPHSSVVVVAIDFGTTYSGYAFAFTRDPDSIHMMRKWEGGDPGVNNQKIPTTLLLRPDGSFHSFGYGARDFYHDLEHTEAKKWLYFEKFKMSLHTAEVCWKIYLNNFYNSRPQFYCVFTGRSSVEQDGLRWRD